MRFAGCVAAGLVLGLISATAAWSKAPDLALCARMSADLATAQAELKSDMDRLKSGTAELDETRKATLTSDQRTIERINTQMSAEGCPGSPPVKDAPAALGGGGASSGENTANGGTGSGGTKPIDPAAPFNGDYDTHTELGVLHLELDPDGFGNGFEMGAADYRGPGIGCTNYEGGGRVYRGYFKPDARYPDVKDYGSCEGVCVMACVDDGGVLTGKFADRTVGGASKNATLLMGTFMMVPQRPNEPLTGNYRVTGKADTSDSTAPYIPWNVTRR